MKLLFVPKLRKRSFSLDLSRMIAVRAPLLSPAFLFTIVICHVLVVAQAQNHCKGSVRYGSLNPSQVKIARDIEIAYCRGRQVHGNRVISRKKMYDYIYSQLRYQQSKECMKKNVNPDDLNMCMHLMYYSSEIWQCFGVIYC